MRDSHSHKGQAQIVSTGSPVPARLLPCRSGPFQAMQRNDQARATGQAMGMRAHSERRKGAFLVMRGTFTEEDGRRFDCSGWDRVRPAIPRGVENASQHNERVLPHSVDPPHRQRRSERVAVSGEHDVPSSVDRNREQGEQDGWGPPRGRIQGGADPVGCAGSRPGRNDHSQPRRCSPLRAETRFR